MSLSESPIQLATPSGPVPALLLEETSRRAKATVLVYHGLSAEKEVQRKEMIWLAEAGFRAIGIDAPHHGEREDGYLEKTANAPDAHDRVMKIVHEAVREVPAILDDCCRRFSGNIGITGISLGGYIAYGAVPVCPQIKAAVPILGSPDWSPLNGLPSETMRTLMEHMPVRFPDRFPPCALFAANAGKDVHVPAERSREFIRRLRQEYRSFPERLKYQEYPESEHMMREEDWNHLWDQILRWFDLFLSQ